MKNAVIMQARMGSTRLSGKVMKELCGKSILAHDIERISIAKLVDEIIVATTIDAHDDIIVKEALKFGAKVFRGSEEDVLSRYYYAAKENNIDVIIRITSDCPLIDPNILDKLIQFFNEHSYDYVSNQSPVLEERTYPRGLDIEVFTFNKLEEAFNNAKEHYQREHVTPYIYENSTNIYRYKSNVNYSKYRWTLDTIEDWNLISKVYEYLYKGKHDFFMEDIFKLMKKHPELEKINNMIEQKVTVL